MKVTIDPSVNAVYLELRAGAVKESEEVAPSVVLDFDAEDNVVGIELLDVPPDVRVLGAAAHLLETCKATLATLDHMERFGVPPDGRTVQEARDRVRAAIREATGSSV